MRLQPLLLCSFLAVGDADGYVAVHLVCLGGLWNCGRRHLERCHVRKFPKLRGQGAEDQGYFVIKGIVGGPMALVVALLDFDFGRSGCRSVPINVPSRCSPTLDRRGALRFWSIPNVIRAWPAAVLLDELDVLLTRPRKPI